MRRRISPWLLLVAVLVGAVVALIWLDARNARQNAPESARVHRQPERLPRARSPRGERQGATAGESACPGLGINCDSQYFAPWQWPADGSCQIHVKDGYPEPDARCTPGGVVPGVTADTLRSADWSTRCIRNCQSTEKQKHAAYGWYALPAPSDNNGATQTCELDHLVPLELGGADGMGNIWPQCGPDEVTLRERYFKQKDIVENYLAARVRAGDMALEEAQRGIAEDWVQYLHVAKAFCRGQRCEE